MNRSNHGIAHLNSLLGKSRGPAMHGFIGIVGLLTVFHAADRLIFKITRLPGDAYQSSVILGKFATESLISTPIGLATTVALLALVGLAIMKRTMGPRWEDLSDGREFRILVAVVVLMLTWTYATYAYNHFYDHLHLADRLLLIGLVPLLLWRPSFVIAYLLILLPIVWQFDSPIGGLSWAEPVLLVRVLVLVCSAYALNVVYPALRSSDVVFVLCCMIAAHYWVSGFGKVAIGWPLIDHVHFLLPATYANGWWGFVSPDTIAVWTGRLASANVLMKTATLAIECGALFILLNRTATRILLSGFVLLHVGIFLVTGILFWKWMILNGTVLALFFAGRSLSGKVHSRKLFVLSLVLIGGGSIWFRPFDLVWLDVPVSYTYRVTAEMDDGRSFPLPPAYFAPYDYQFTLGAFSYLSEDPVLGIVWGATRDRVVVDSLLVLPRRSTVESLERTRGVSHSNQRRRGSFESFVAGFVLNRQSDRSRAAGILGRGRAPAQLWTFPRTPKIPPGAVPSSIHVDRITSLFDGSSYLEIDSVRVADIDLSPR